MSDRTSPPHDLPSERALLGGLMRDPVQLPRVDAVLTASDFYHPAHALLFDLLRSLERDGVAIDLVSVAERVNKGGRADRFGGAGYVVELPECAPSTANLMHYARTIREKSALRAVLGMARQLEELVRDESNHVLDVLDTSAARLLELAGEQRRTEDSGRLGDALVAAGESRARQLEHQQVDAIPTRLWSLDQILDGGLRPGELVVIGADTSGGKTSLAIAMALAVAAQGHSVGYALLEGNEREFADRALANIARVSLGKLRSPVRRDAGQVVPALTDEDEQRIAEWMEVLPRWPLRWWKAPFTRWSDVQAQARRWRMQHGIRVLVVDYVQRMFDDHDTAMKIPDRAKSLAETLGITVILLSQLTTRGDREQRNRPQHRKLSDSEPWWEQVPLPRRNQLRNSAELEHAADVILLPVRADALGLGLDDRGEAVIVVDKNRNGRTGVVPVRWDPRCAAYRSDTWSDHGSAP